MRAFAVGIACCVVLLAPTMSLCQPARRQPGLAPHRIIRKLFESQGKQRYSGTRVVEFRLEGAQYRNIELVLVDGTRTRTEFAPGSTSSGQIIVESNGKRLQYLPESREVHVLPARRDEAMVRLRRMVQDADRKLMKLEVTPGETIAARPTQLVTLSTPRGNVLQRLWLDAETSVPLKRELFDLTGTRVGFFEYSKINYRPAISETAFDLKPSGAKLITMEQQLARISRELGFEPYRLPPSSGYRLEMVRKMRIGQKPVMMQLYFGTGSRVSLYQIDGTIEPNRFRRIAGPQLGTHVWQIGSRSLALVGDVPKSELQRLASTVTKQG